MGKRSPILEPLDEDIARRIAHILGPQSAAAKALNELELRRKDGDDIALFTYGDTILVGPRDG